MLIEIDLPKESVKAFRELCANHKIEIQGVQEIGPAGGNPCFSVAIHDLEALVALGTFYFG